MRYSRHEVIDLVKAWIAISIAFAIAFVGFSQGFLIGLVISALTVGIGFLLHELSHKRMALKYGCSAEFRSSDPMLLLMIGISFLGFVFAAPGAVYIYGGRLTREQNGKVSAAGPAINIILAIAFFLIALFIPGAFFKTLGLLGFGINAWLALFNLIPVWNLDGKKVLAWSLGAWILLVAVSGFFTYLYFTGFRILGI